MLLRIDQGSSEGEDGVYVTTNAVGSNFLNFVNVYEKVV